MSTAEHPTAFIWYDKTATDDRVWCVQRNGVTVRAKVVIFEHAVTAFAPEGFKDLQPSGPRGMIMAENVTTRDEVPL